MPFWGLIEQAVGQHAVRAILDKPEVFARKFAALDEDVRRLTLLMPQGGGLAREHERFRRAMALFAVPYPADRAVRAKPCGYRGRAETSTLSITRCSRSPKHSAREPLARQIIDYVSRTPELFARVEALREKLGDNDRLRHLTDALARKIDWSKSVADIYRNFAGAGRVDLRSRVTPVPPRPRPRGWVRLAGGGPDFDRQQMGRAAG